MGIDKSLVSNKTSSSEENYKYFICYLHDYYKIESLNIMLPKTSAYVKEYDGQSKWMYFLIEDDDLLNKHNNICNRVSTDIKNEFDSGSVYNNTFLKTK